MKGRTVSSVEILSYIFPDEIENEISAQPKLFQTTNVFET